MSQRNAPSPSAVFKPQALLWIATLVAAACGTIYGYDTGIISGSLPLIASEFHIGSTGQEIVASAILAGAVLGTLIAGQFTETIGRKRTLIGVAAVLATGAMACGLATNVTTLVLARFYIGLGSGGATQVVPIYISEIAPAKVRGRMVTIFNITLGAGIVFADLLSILSEDRWGWRSLISLMALPSAVICGLALFLPRSPRWVAENKGEEEAVRELRKVRESDVEVQTEVRQILEALHKVSPEDRGWRGLRQRWMRPALVAALGVAFFTQLTGLEMMIYYAPTFLAESGFGRKSALFVNLGVASIYMLMMLVGNALVDRVGRRRMVLVMGPGAALSLLGLGALFLRPGVAGGFNAYLVVVLLFAFIFFNSGGIQVIGWLSGSEMFPLSMRGPAVSVHAAMLWGSDFLATSTILTFTELVSVSGALWFYAVVNIVSVFFVLYCVPETAGRTLEDIEGSLRTGSFLEGITTKKRMVAK